MTEAVEEGLLRALVDRLPAMLAYWDAGLRCRFANRAYEKWFGVTPEAMIGRDMKGFLGPLFALNLPYIEGALRGEEQEFEREIPDPAGGPARHSQAHYIPDVVDGKVRGFCVLVADITRRTRAEEALHEMERRLRATERLTAMATLAAGIAHEINNPLASTLATLDLTLDRLEREPLDAASLKAALVDARDSGRRVRDIVRSMKLLAEGDATRRELVDVDGTLEKSIDLAANATRYHARVVRSLDHGGFIEGSGVQLAQVFVNLLVNAAQALPEDRAERNEIRVSTRRDGGQVNVEIADNGCGIPEALQARIFEPFFTTKDVGRGMGLGLSISSEIARGFGGSISVTSKVGEGSVFRIVLPSASGPILDAPSLRAPREDESLGAPAPARSGGRPRVLVVDDDAVVARTLVRILEDDYDVTVVTSGRQAIARVSEEELRFDAILCDLMMPDVTGIDVYDAVTRTRQALASRFVVMTGGAFTPRGRQFLESVRAPVLEKPFDVGRVRAVVAGIARPAGERPA